MSINNVNLVGNITKDPNLSRTSSDYPILSFSIAVNERKKDSDGNWTNVPLFVDCTMFGKYGEAMQKYIGKGTKVAVGGKLARETWTNKNGEKRSAYKVYVDDLEIMSQSKDGSKAAQGHTTLPVIEADYEYSDIPF